MLPIKPRPPVTIIFFIIYFFTFVKTISIVEYTYHMSISRQNLTVIIVTFKSENVIHECIQSIGNDIKVLIIDNSNSKEFKENVENKYKNVFTIHFCL